MDKYKFLKPKKIFRNSNPFAIQSGHIHSTKLDTLYRQSWSEDTFISDTKQKETIGLSFDYSKLPIIVLGILLAILMLLAKTAWLQIVKGDDYYALAENNRVRIERLEPKRGVIYDVTGRPLVRNQANFVLYVVPADLPGEEESEKLKVIIDEIASTVTSLNSEYIMTEIKSIDRYSLEAFRPLFLIDNIPYEIAMKVYIKSDNWPGFILTNKTRREYLVYSLDPDTEKKPYTYSMSHILGYTGKINEQELIAYGDEYRTIDYIGKMGIEYFWENELKGVSGSKHIEKDALGREKKILKEVSAEDGHNLVLSIDTKAQLKLEEIITEQLEKLNKSKASAVLMDPRNGEIRAMVSLPAYNNNSFAQGIGTKEYQDLITHPGKPLFNRAVSGEFPPGSTIKPMMAVAALEEGVVSEYTTFLSTGGIRIGEWFFPDWRAGGHGRVDVRRAIAESVNTYFYYIGGGYEDFVGLGVDRIVEYGKLFGLGTQTGIDLAGEASGFLPTREWKQEAKKERWYIGDTYHLAIGQGDLSATPLQIAAMTAVFANGGNLYRPHFVKEVLNGDDEVINLVEAEAVRSDFIDNYNLMVVRSGMRQTVTAGSARSLSSLPVTMAGKTGTAQWSSKHDYHAWFTGFAPYDDPELVITVLVEEGGEGSDAAVPIVREFMQWYYSDN